MPGAVRLSRESQSGEIQGADAVFRLLGPSPAGAGIIAVGKAAEIHIPVGLRPHPEDQLLPILGGSAAVQGQSAVAHAPADAGKADGRIIAFCGACPALLRCLPGEQIQAALPAVDPAAESGAQPVKFLHHVGGLGVIVVFRGLLPQHKGAEQRRQRQGKNGQGPALIALFAVIIAADEEQSPKQHQTDDDKDRGPAVYRDAAGKNRQRTQQRKDGPPVF